MNTNNIRECKICYNESTLIQSECGSIIPHELCLDCENKIFNINNKCPFCRGKLRDIESESESESDFSIELESDSESNRNQLLNYAIVAGDT